jgi:hypothetical protein
MSKLIRQGDANLASFGQLGGQYITSADGSVTPPSGQSIVAIQSLDDATKFSAMTSAPNTGYSYPVLGSTVALPSGVTLFGQWSALTVSAGGAVVYFA